MEVSIVGGGIIGLCTAYYLQKDGHQVTVIERGNLTDGCSFGNLGYVSPSHFLPLATPGIVAQGIKWMFDASSPFYIKPRLNLDLMRWGLAFYNSANQKTLDANAPHMNHLIQLSRQLIVDLKREIGDNFDLTENGCWMLYKNQKTGDHEKHLADIATSFGLQTVVCNAQQVQEREKEVEVNVAGGVLYVDDCYIEPAKLMHALHNTLKIKGVIFKLNTTVTGFEVQGNKVKAVLTPNESIKTDEIVIANGSWLPETARLLGQKILLEAGKGYSFSYQNLSNNLTLPSILVDDRVATTPYNRMLRIGGTMEISGHSTQKLPKRIRAIYDAFQRYYPGIEIAPPDPATTWYGYRPVTPDGVPYIGGHDAFENVYIAGGHAMLGVTAATGTGQLMAQLIGKTQTSIDIQAFNPNRF